MIEVDLVIVGAGPAGMGAATTAGQLGLNGVVLDEQQAVGGQIYRGITAINQRHANILGEDYLYGRTLVKAMDDTAVRHVKGAVVWSVQPGGQIAYSIDQVVHQIKAHRLIIASGALERTMPIPGWTLPGVMTAGAGQILLKQSGLVGRQAVIAGSGPLIYLLAQQMIKAGAAPLALVETQSFTELRSAMIYAGGAMRGLRYIKEGMQMLADIRKAGVRRISGATDLHITGRDRVQNFHYTQGNKTGCIECDLVLLHQGVVPNTQISHALGVKHEWNQAQHCFRPVLNKWYQSSHSHIYLSGDCSGIIGARAAEYSGRLAALHAAASLDSITVSERDSLAGGIRKVLQKELAIRPFLDAAYRPHPSILNPHDDTVVCRCEEVTAGDIRRYAKLGCKGPNQAKAFSRCGMGPCQGRYCGLAVTHILAVEGAMQHDDVGYYRIRPPIKPITLSELASLNTSH